MVFSETANGFQLSIVSEENETATLLFEYEKQIASKPENVEPNIRQQLSKLGNSIYELQHLEIKLENAWFFPASVLSEWRRQAIEKLDEVRANNYVRELPRIAEHSDFPTKQLTYLGNVTNKNAEAFYREHGVEDIQPGFEIKHREGVPLMFTKHCIKYEMGWCPREGYKEKVNEPFFLTHKGQKFELRFDCKKCEMEVIG